MTMLKPPNDFPILLPNLQLRQILGVIGRCRRWVGGATAVNLATTCAVHLKDAWLTELSAKWLYVAHLGQHWYSGITCWNKTSLPDLNAIHYKLDLLDRSTVQPVRVLKRHCITFVKNSNKQKLKPAYFIIILYSMSFDALNGQTSITNGLK